MMRAEEAAKGKNMCYGVRNKRAGEIRRAYPCRTCKRTAGYFLCFFSLKKHACGQNSWIYRESLIKESSEAKGKIFPLHVI